VSSAQAGIPNGSPSVRTLMRRWLFVAALAVTVTFVSATSATAGHTSWHANHHIWDPSPSQYAAYSHTKSGSSSDFLHARVQVWRNGVLKGDRSTTCGVVDEGCSNEQTSTVYWSQGGGGHEVESWHCGQDGTHHLFLNGLGCWSGGYTGTAILSSNSQWDD